jgi:hypothetical protein
MGGMDPFTCLRLQNKTMLTIKRKDIKIEKSEARGNKKILLD